ncbi:MAG: flagellar type III secretion system pore protein FliP [Pseudomonadota bacterium]
MNRFLSVLPALLIAALPTVASGAEALPALPALEVETADDGTQSYSVSLQLLAIMTFLTLLPSVVIMLTGFTRIIIVFAILRQAIGLQQTPSNQILIGLALFLTLFVMTPVMRAVEADALEPYLEDEIGAEDALVRTSDELKAFMLNQTRETDLALFARLSESPVVDDPADIDFFVVVPAFMTSELKTAFQIGFMLFVPFLVIDMVVASVLMSMGMMMLSPLIISLPFKIMLFVLVDGWVLIMGTLASSFGMLP